MTWVWGVGAREESGLVDDGWMGGVDARSVDARAIDRVGARGGWVCVGGWTRRVGTGNA